jgi:hypothetical protein
MNNAGEARFDPPGDAADGNDWVLLLDSAEADLANREDN